jgi:hypothetical protein
MKKTSVIKPRKYAAGGTGQGKHMFGVGDRTRTAPADAAIQQTSGWTGHSTAKQVRPPQERVDVAGDIGGTGGESRPRKPG